MRRKPHLEAKAKRVVATRIYGLEVLNCLRNAAETATLLLFVEFRLDARPRIQGNDVDNFVKMFMGGREGKAGRDVGRRHTHAHTGTC